MKYSSEVQALFNDARHVADNEVAGAFRVMSEVEDAAVAFYVWLADVEIEEGEKIVKVENEKYKAHSITISNIRELWTVEVFKELVDNGADIVWALNVSSEYGCLEVVKYLFDNGADIYSDDKNYALHLASQNGHLEIVKYLYLSLRFIFIPPHR